MKPSLRKIRRERKQQRLLKKFPWCASFLDFAAKEEAYRKSHTYNLVKLYTSDEEIKKDFSRDIYTEVAKELGVDRREVKSKALHIMYSPYAPENYESLQHRIK